VTLVTTIIPAFNAERFIDEAIESVLLQTYSSIEVIVVDDGSTDDTVDRLAKYGSRIRCVHQENRGPAAARNHGLKLASGSLIAFLDADDVWLPEKIKRQVEFSCANPTYGIITTDTLTFGEMGILNDSLHNYYPISNGFALEKLLFHNWISASAAMVRRECFEQIGGFDEMLGPDGKGQCTAEDWLMWMKIAAHYSVYFIDEVLTRHRIHASNYSQVRDNYFEYALINLGVMRRSIPQLGEKPELVNRAAARICKRGGLGRLRETDLADARSKFRRGLEYRSLSPLLWLLYLSTFLPDEAFRAAKQTSARLKRTLKITTDSSQNCISRGSNL
jgi:glycosyltransferase involved in cell wall biosynthesis